MAVKHFIFNPKGVCSTQIDIDIDMDKQTIEDVYFTGGCDGNLKAISILTRGMTIDQVRAKLEGLQCGTKRTSCSDQFCQALAKIQKGEL